MSERYTVRAERCDHRASGDEIYRTLERITEPLTRSWERLERARRIVIKFNMMHPNTARHHGRRQELVDEEVMRAVLRLLRARTKATLVAADTCVHTAAKTVRSNFESAEVLREFGVELVETSQPPLRLYDVPGGGNMFDRYLLTSCIGESDEFVSVAKMKNHLFMGVTLCMKNLFGLPASPECGGGCPGRVWPPASTGTWRGRSWMPPSGGWSTTSSPTCSGPAGSPRVCASATSRRPPASPSPRTAA